MARDRDRNSSPRRDRKDAARKGKKKVCMFCAGKSVWVDYKDVNLLRQFMSERGKIRARRVSGNCAQHQSDVAIAIKTARELALLPYTRRTVTERGGGRGGGGGRGPGGRRPDAAPVQAVESDPASEELLDLVPVDAAGDEAGGDEIGAGGGDLVDDAEDTEDEG